MTFKPEAVAFQNKDQATTPASCYAILIATLMMKKVELIQNIS